MSCNTNPRLQTESKSHKKQKSGDQTSTLSRTLISLSPREQSLLYCELEYHVSNCLHDYIVIQLEHGRLDEDKLAGIAKEWSQKGRPRVVEYRYDLETQINLIHTHMEHVRFYGRRQGNPVELAGLLHAMKVNARSMRIRTFCQPDSVIAKQLVDSQSLFNTLGASEHEQIALAEVVQFFKVIVERQQVYREKQERQAIIAAIHNQGEDRWQSHETRHKTVEQSDFRYVPIGYAAGSEDLIHKN
jgi:hypothetical protein